MTGVWFVAGALATFRLAWLVAFDTITAPARDWIERRGDRARNRRNRDHDDHDPHASAVAASVWPWLAILVACPWCMSVWVGLPVAVFVGGPWRLIVLSWLAYSGITGLLANAGQALAAIADR